MIENRIENNLHTKSFLLKRLYVDREVDRNFEVPFLLALLDFLFWMAEGLGRHGRVAF